jgi:hypothetical protein
MNVEISTNQLIVYPSKDQDSASHQGCCIHARDIMIILPFLYLNRPRLKVIFKTIAQYCLLIIMKYGGHGGIRM